MTVKINKYQSVNLTRFYMRIVGFWLADTKREQFFMNCALVYAILAIAFAIGVEGIDLYYCFGDFYAMTYNLCSTMLLIIIMVKLTSFMVYRDLIMNMISYAETNFWKIDYDDFGKKVLKECDKKGVLLTYGFTIIVQSAALSYIVAPLIENMSRNETDKQLPFKIWFDLPMTSTPYYEVTYTIQSLSTIHSGICTFCFDNFICCFNIHVAAQLKILAHKIEVIGDTYLEKMNKNIEPNVASDAAVNLFKDCVREHLALINFIGRMERAFTWILFGQLLLSSMLICFGGFQFLAAESLVRQCLFVLHFFGSICQLFLYTWTCNDITFQSEQIAVGAYSMRWYLLPNDDNGKLIKDGVIMVMNRASRPCVLTAGRFAPMSLETFTSIMSTAASYFTLLQQMSAEDE